MLEYSKGAKVLIMQKSLDDTDNQQERLKDLAWLAGLWEGEGHFTIVSGSKNRLFPKVGIVNTDIEMIEEIVRLLKKYEIGHYLQARKNYDPARHKNSSQISIVGAKRVKTFLDLLLPYTRCKKQRVAILLLEFVDRRLELGRSKTRYDFVDFNYVKQIRKLNKKGPSESSETICQPSNEEDIVQVA